MQSNNDDQLESYITSPVSEWSDGRGQHEALLKDENYSDDEESVNHSYRPESRAWKKTFTILLALCSCVALLSAGIIWTSAVSRPKPKAEPSVVPVSTPSPTSSAAHNRYLLSSDWNIDAVPQVREYHWTVEDRKHNPDGVYRPMILINGEYPGPMIEVNEGDTIVVHVENKGSNATAFHWHGIYQNGTNWMDGTVGITQCPIAPGAKFTYNFTVIGQAGTYWYHGHYGAQASDGLLGPLVIHSKQDKELQRIDYATDRVVMVQDHYYDLSGALLMDYLAPDAENAEPVPDSALINGMNIRDCSRISNRKCDNSTSGLPTFNLARGQRHRLRFINVGAFAEFQIQVDEHEFAVTEVDGTDVVPAYYHRLNINPAQRYSIIVDANVTSADMFWLRARMITHCFAEEKPEMEAEARAIIRYTDEPAVADSHKMNDVSPVSRDWPEVIELECRDMNTSELVPAQAIAAPEKVDTSFYLRSNFEIGAYRLSRGFFNHSSWRADIHSPTLDRVVEGLHASNTSFKPTTDNEAPTAFINDQAFDVDRELVIQSQGIAVIDLLISNFDDGNHPLHLHGYKYFVLATGHGYPKPDLLAHVDLSNPLRRDTASVEAFGWILIRLIADNPGAWAFHCHISWHTEAGLMMQLVTRTDEMAKWNLPSEVKGLCDAPGSEKGAVPADEIFMVDER